MAATTAAATSSKYFAAALSCVWLESSTPFIRASARRVATPKFSQPGIGFHCTLPYLPPVIRLSGEQSTTAIG